MSFTTKRKKKLNLKVLNCVKRETRIFAKRELLLLLLGFFSFVNVLLWEISSARARLWRFSLFAESCAHVGCGCALFRHRPKP